MAQAPKDRPKLKALKTLAGPVHFVGIGGAGMSALAELVVKGGTLVSGSDSKASPALTQLEGLGVRVQVGHTADALGDAKTVVFSSAIAPENVELVAARDAGLPVWHRSELLAALLAPKQGITIAGAHGKSTTTAMIAHVLDALGVDPSVACGATIRRYDSPARFGKGLHFVAEADESDGSFLRYEPLVGVVTNIAPDHMEYFKDTDALCSAFSEYLANIVEDGTAVVGWDSALARDVGRRYEGNRLTFGFLIGSDVRGLDVKTENGETSFLAMVERDQVRCRLKMLGRHNVQNALATLAVVRALSLDVKRAAAALAEFTGVARRMALVHDEPELKIFDDYAHNPGKIEASIAALREGFPGWRLHVVFQPHRYSRLETMWGEMLDALKGVDLVHVLPVYAAGETTTQDFSPAVVAKALRDEVRVQAVACATFADAAKSVRDRLEYPAVVLTVGAGDVDRVATLLAQDLAKERHDLRAQETGGLGPLSAKT